MSLKFLVASTLALAVMYGCSTAENETAGADIPNATTRTPAQTSNAEVLGYVQTGALVKVTDPATGTVCYVAERSGHIDLECMK